MEGIVVKNPLYPWLDTTEYSEPPSCLYSRWIVTSRVQDSRLQHHSFPQKALERTGFLNPRYETGLLEKFRIIKDQLRQIFSELEWCTGYFSLTWPMNLTNHFKFSNMLLHSSEATWLSSHIRPTCRTCDRPRSSVHSPHNPSAERSSLTTAGQRSSLAHSMQTHRIWLIASTHHRLYLPLIWKAKLRATTS